MGDLTISSARLPRTGWNFHWLENLESGSVLPYLNVITHKYEGVKKVWSCHLIISGDQKLEIYIGRSANFLLKIKKKNFLRLEWLSSMFGTIKSWNSVWKMSFVLNLFQSTMNGHSWNVSDSRLNLLQESVLVTATAGSTCPLNVFAISENSVDFEKHHVS